MSHRIADILFFVLLTSAAVGQLLIIGGVLRTPAVVRGPGETTVRRSRELLWTLLPAIALGAAFAGVWRVLHG